MYWRRGSAPAARRGPRRWIAADVADLVDVSAGAGEAPRGADSGASFAADLRLLRRRILRRWALAAAARYALLALAVALVPAALAALGAITWAWALVVPVAVFLVALGLRLARPPSTERVARLLDDRLGLFDVVATALQVERSDEPTDDGTAALVIADAAAYLRDGERGWRVRARFGSRELGAAALFVAALVALAVVGGGSGSGGSAGRGSLAVAPGKAGRKHPRMTNVSPPLAPPKAKRAGARKEANGQEHRSPLGLYDFGFEGKRPLPKVKGGRRSGLYSRGAPKSGAGPRSFAAQSPGEGNEAREKAEEEASGGKGGAKEAPSGEGRQGKGGAPESLKSLTGGKAPPAGSVSPVPSGAGGQTASKAGTSAGAAGAGGGHTPSGGSGSPHGGSPSGGSAGHGRAALAAGESGKEAGGTGGGPLGLRAGFAASRGGKAASGRGPRDAQGGGGPGRSAGIAGSAFEESSAGALGYVPPDAGIAASTDPGLFTRYLNALAAIGGRRW
jgi:hypothetical protein